MSSSDMSKTGPSETERKSQPSFRVFPSSPDEEVVISGMAGRYPNCDNVEDYRRHLFNKVSFRTFTVEQQFILKIVI